MDETTLVVLAAGMGSRFGGLKQMEGLGPNGEVLLEYSVRDALAHGFDRVVFVIRRDIEADFVRLVLPHLPSDLAYELAYQELDKVPLHFQIPAGRTKPWGTAHALWCAQDAIPGNFAVINADDYYGEAAFKALGDYLARGPRPGEWALVAYSLEATLSDYGHVSRGVCTPDAQDYLIHIEEHRLIARQGHRIVGTNPQGKEVELAPGTQVSMNCWAFTPDFLDFVDTEVEGFFRELAQPGSQSHSPDPLRAESYLPQAAELGFTNGDARCRLLRTDARWCGVTYPGDRARVQSELLARHQRRG